jgi:predicted HTH transcriptional regulator
MNEKDLIEWAKTQKRVTNKYIRDRFGVDYETADKMYKLLKDKGIIMGMGYVVEDIKP